MRLTLRTLLAYLDDVLPPQETRQIGEKIAASKDATAFVARIKEVIRKRRIGSPEIAGAGSGPDPNIVAEYLENLLPPDLVVELEKICQTSDLHLAEVASSHKILTLILGQPIDASDELRERMYSLPGVTKVDAVQGDSVKFTEGISNLNQPISGLPDYLKSNQNRYQQSLITGLLLILIGWVLLVATDGALWNRTRPVTNPVAENSSQTPGEIAKPTDKTLEKPTDAAGPVIPVPVDDPVKTDLPPAAVVNTIPPRTTPVSNPDEQEMMPLAPVLEETHPELTVVYHDGDGFYYARHTDSSEWYVAPRQFDLNVGDQIASPLPFRNGFRVEDAFDVTLHGGTRVERIAQGPNANFGLKLFQGQVGIYLPAEAQQRETIRLNLLGKDWFLTLLEPTTRVGIELIPPTPNGPPEDGSDATVGGGIVVLEGRISISTEGHPLVELTASSGYARWPSEGTRLVTRVDLSVPAWATSEGIQLSNAARQIAETFRRSVPEGQDIEVSLQPLVNERRASTADLAMKSFSLIGDWRALVPGLSSEHQDVRITAIQGLKNWLALHPSRANELLTVLAQRFGDADSQRVLRLLWGFTLEDAHSALVSKTLVESLKHPEIAIRELAFHAIAKLTSRTNDYLPMGPEVERNAAIQRWETVLNQNNGALLPPNESP